MNFEQWYNQYILKLPPDKQFTKEDMQKAWLAGYNESRREDRTPPI